MKANALPPLFFLALAAVTITGCTSTQETTTSGPRKTAYHSRHPAPVAEAPEDEPARVYDPAMERFVRTGPYGTRGNRTDGF